MLNRFARPLAVLAIALLMAGALVGCGGSKSKGDPTKNPAPVPDTDKGAPANDAGGEG